MLRGAYSGGSAQQIDLFWKKNREGKILAEVDNMSWQVKCWSVSVTERGAVEAIYPET